MRPIDSRNFIFLFETTRRQFSICLIAIIIGRRSDVSEKIAVGPFIPRPGISLGCHTTVKPGGRGGYSFSRGIGSTAGGSNITERRTDFEVPKSETSSEITNKQVCFLVRHLQRRSDRQHLNLHVNELLLGLLNLTHHCQLIKKSDNIQWCCHGWRRRLICALGKLMSRLGFKTALLDVSAILYS